jgi:ComF family protein
MVLAGPGCVSCGRPEPALPAHDPAFRCDLCLACPPDWDTVRGVALYRGGVRRMILRLKHGDRLDIVPAMARMMARAGRREIARANLVVPVPLHWTRRLARRFNQSAELAREACRIAGRRDAHAPTLLRRIRATESQEGKTREERLRNLDGAFALPRPRAVAGRRILLVDDVMTTGATVGSAARTLKAAGAARVDVLAMALVPAPSLAYLGTDETRSAGADPSAPGMERRSDA